MQRTALDLRYYANPRQLVNVSYLMDRYQPDLSLERSDPLGGCVASCGR